MLLSLSEFIGRFHPALVHLPIGILLIGILLQWLSGYPKYNVSVPVIKIVLLIGTFSALLSCITGYLLSTSGDYEDDLVSWHMWMGIGVAFASLLFLQRVLTGRRDSGTKLTSVSLLVLIVLTGHFGGSLTHGAGYLTAAATANDDNMVTARPPIADIQKAQAYADIIQPVLEARCYGCHNAQKKKGGLRLDSPQWLLKGGKDGNVLTAGDAAASELYKRLILPASDDHHMPPKQKPQPSEREIALIHWWIDAGADFTKSVGSLPQPEKIKPVLLTLQSGTQPPKQPSTVPGTPVEKGDEKAINALRQRGAVVVPVAKGSNYLSVNFVAAPAVTNDDIQQLRSLKNQLVWLKLNDVKLLPAAVSAIGECSTITILYLNNTGVTDGDISQLNKLTNLQVLSVVDTRISATGLARLSGLTKLQAVYAAGTGVKAGDTARLRKWLNGAVVNTGGYNLPVLPTDTARLTRPAK